ncbi:MAG TPA: hypothetical protein VFU99_06970 [Gaiellaceae bacterium]|nr:hypothetical protein [Gaiellaceae bacterium]
MDAQDVLALSRVVGHGSLSQKLAIAARLRWAVVNLTVNERHAILASLGNTSGDLEELRERLLESHPWRLRERL